MIQAPQHPGRQEQGLGAPSQQGQPQQVQNPYYQPSVAMGQYNANKSGQAELEKAQIAEAGAEAGRAQGQQQMLEGLAMKGLEAERGAQAQQQQEMQGMVQEVASGIASGQLGQEQLSAMVQDGQIPGEVAQAAVGMAQEMAAQQAPQGLGGQLAPAQQQLV